MTSLAKARLHSIFPVERRGDTLVVTPQGDAIGFSPNQIQVELRGLEKLIGQSDGANLIVDLEHTNYFGSEMIGLINRLGLNAHQRGGRIAMCNVSADMQGILDVMKFDEIWESYDSTSAALRAIASIPITERIADNKNWIYGAATLGALALAIFYFPWPDKNRDYYKQFMAYSTELKQMRKAGKGASHRNGYRKRVEREMRPILKELSDASYRGDLGAAYLYLAGKECLMPMLQANGATRSELEHDFAVNMTQAAKFIDDVQPPGELPPNSKLFKAPAGIERSSRSAKSERATRNR